MNNLEYTSWVEFEKYPEDPGVPLGEYFNNEAGEIQNLLVKKVSTVTVIKSVLGSIRSNHFHKTDWHYMYVVSGRMEYIWRPAGSREIPNRRIFRPGELMFTPPLVEHATFFPEETVLMTFAKNVRNHDEHEDDLVRVKLIEKRPFPSGVPGDGEWQYCAGAIK